MCNIPLISALIIAAQASFATAIGLVTTASSLNGNLFLAGGAPILMTGAAIAIAAAITSLTAAAREAANCAAACPGQTAKLLADIAALNAALVGLSATVAATTLVTAIPFAAKFALAGIIATFGFAGVISFTLTTDLVALSTCAAAAPTPPPVVTIIVTVLNALLTIGIAAVLIGGIASGIIPLLPVPLG